MALFLLKKTWCRFDYRLRGVKDVGWFLTLAPWLPAAFSAIFVQTFLLLAHIVPPNRYAGEVLVFWLGNSTGIMLVTPIILVWRDIFKFQWTGAKGRRILFLLGGVALALLLLHASSLPNYLRMCSVLVVPFAVWGIWSTGFRGATLFCLLTSFIYFILDIPASRPLSLLLNERHLQANIGFLNTLIPDSPLNRILPPPTMLEEALGQIGILTTLCLTILPLGAAADELRRRGEQDDLVLRALDSSFWTWTQKDGLQFFNSDIVEKIGAKPLLFEAHLPSGKMMVPAITRDHPGYYSHWTVVDTGSAGEPLVINGLLQSRGELSRREEAEARAELANMEIKALRAHLNPHLIFNCLTGLRGMIKANPDLARDFTGRLARFLRAVVDSQVSTLITLAHELEICHDYIELESIRGRSISLTHETKPADKSIFLPPLSLVTLVENAVKHGTPTPEGKLPIRFACQRTKKNEICLSLRHPGRIKNNGKGNNPGGLSLLRQQLQTSFPSFSKVELLELPGPFVETRIFIPYPSLS